MKKFFSILMTVMMLCSSFSIVLAEEGADAAAGVAAPGIGNNLFGDSGATTFVEGLLGTIQFVGYAIAIGMLIYAGIRYVMAPANEKADLKSAMIKYVIGAILIAGASSIAGWIFTVGKTA